MSTSGSFSSNVIFQPSKEQMRASQPLDYFLERYDGNNIEIKPENMPDFTAYVMPLLTKIG